MMLGRSVLGCLFPRSFWVVKCFHRGREAPVVAVSLQLSQSSETAQNRFSSCVLGVFKIHLNPGFVSS